MENKPKLQINLGQLVGKAIGDATANLTKEMMKEIKIRMPKSYIINKNAGILFWQDGDKTVVKRTEGDEPNKRMAFLTAYFQKMSGLSKRKANEYLDSLICEDEEK